MINTLRLNMTLVGVGADQLGGVTLNGSVEFTVDGATHEVIAAGLREQVGGAIDEMIRQLDYFQANDQQQTLDITEESP